MISIVKALTALTTLRLQQTAESLLETKNLLERINESIKRVFEIYPATDPTYIKKRRLFLAKKKKILIANPLYVFVSSNKELYGDLIANVGHLFIEDLKKGQADGLVIGKIGKILVEREKLPAKIYYFDLDDDRPNLNTIQKMLAILEKYDKVVVYHGKSESLVRQIAISSEVERTIPAFVKPAKKYFFEPTPEEVLDFLETQIAMNSFHQKIYEAQLARLSARRWNWTKQQLARGRLLEELTLEFIKFKKSLASRQQQVTLAAHRLATGL